MRSSTSSPMHIGSRRPECSLEPMCMGEEVDERIATIEENTERVAIYKQHLDAQAALTSATTTAIAAAASATAAALVAGAVVVAEPFVGTFQWQ
jgi:hypothetical protein